MASMKKEEARRAVLSEYDRWAKKHPNDARTMGGFLFFRYLQKERSDLLDFRAVGDKWQIVTAGSGIGWKTNFVMAILPLGKIAISIMLDIEI